ncbi:putative transmembrane protein [Pasteurella bettyae]|nr:YgcG family protein [Pasteurella bettyae]SUB21860.1 putative transmembrane protein [Pasteurella bettyae]
MIKIMDMLKVLRKSAVIFSLIFVSISVWAADFPASPTPFHYVNDYTKTLSENDKNYLENKLIQYSKETSSQISVVIVPTTGEYEVSDYAFALGDKWGIGRKHLNNGVLMLIAKNDHKIFIATGQGLEGALPDAFISQIIRQVMTPNFKQEQYAQGINGALDYIIAASKGEFDPHKIEESEFEKFIPFLMVLVFILVVFFGELRWRRPYVSPTNNHQLEQAILQEALRQRRRGNAAGFGTTIGGGSFGGGFGGGGSSGGGFGGGGFDGGGAGGSW